MLAVCHPETITPCFASHLTGERTLHHKSDVLEIVVLVNPSDDTVVSEVRWTLPDDEEVLEQNHALLIFLTLLLDLINPDTVIVPLLL